MRRTHIPENVGSKHFLGFKHICARSRRGKFTVHVRTIKKRLRRSFNGVAEWCRVHRHDDVSKQQATLNAKLRGHYRYYGRPTNYHSLWQFYRGVRCVWKKWLERRSRGMTLTWEAYGQLLRRYPLLRPRITRPWVARRVAPEESAAVILHDGICEGRGSG
jgi:RNA-directed DNA polymerase